MRRYCCCYSGGNSRSFLNKTRWLLSVIDILDIRRIFSFCLFIISLDARGNGASSQEKRKHLTVLVSRSQISDFPGMESLMSTS